LLNLSSGIIGAARCEGARVLFTLHDYWLSCPRDGLRMRENLALCATIDHKVCGACLTTSPYLVPSLQRGLGSAARGAGLGRHLHRLHDAAPHATEKLLGILKRTSPSDAARLHEGMDRRAAELRRRLEGVDLFLAPTTFVRDRIVEWGVAADKVRVMPLGAVQGPLHPRRAGARRRFGFVGTLAPHKGVHVLLEAFRALEGDDLTLDLHGSRSVHPSYVASLERAAAGDPRIRFRGAFAEGEQPSVLAGLDALVLPSIWWENSPLTVLEAMAAGVAVVASRSGGVPEVVPEGMGLLVPPGDAAALRSALADVAAGRKLGDARPAVALKTVAEGAAELEALYREK
jgi:glycosyltransferase involved in cell wall biosynthesis